MIKNAGPSAATSRLANALDLEVLAAITEYAELAWSLGAEIRVSTVESEMILESKAEEFKIQLAASFRLNSEWIRAELKEHPTKLMVTRDTEVRIAKRTLEHFKMQVSDKFWDNFKDGEELEIYSVSMMQLYRSFGFLKLCGYSLLEISVFEWHELWGRPSHVFKEMMEMALRGLRERVDLASYNHLEHIIREIRPANPAENYQPRACLAQFKYFSSLVDEAGAVVGGVVSSTGRVIAIGDEADRIQFI